MEHNKDAESRKNRKSDIVIWIVILALAAVFITKIPSVKSSLAFTEQKYTPLITEIMSSNNGTVTSSDGRYCDWIELYNPTDQPINLAGFSITDDPEIPDQCVLPYWVLDPGDYVLLYADDQTSTDTELHAPFKLKDKGETLLLFDSKSAEIQRISFPAMETNQAYAMDTDSLEWALTDRCTPGFPNTDEGHTVYQQNRRAYSPVAINEVMASNVITLRDEDGDYSDWVELYNCSLETVDLTGWGLSDTEASPKRWEFPAAKIGPGEYLVVFLSGKNRADSGKELHTDFRINDFEDTVLLSNLRGQIVSEIKISDVAEDMSYALVPGTGEWRVHSQPTPGFPNTTEGWNALQESLYADTNSPIVISEVMSNNAATLQDQFGEYSDWIELCNRSDQGVDLSGWGLSDDTGELGRWLFPSVVLAPGEYFTVYASERDSIVSIKKMHTDFSISALGELVVLTDPAGNVADCCCVPAMRAALSYQRLSQSPSFVYTDQPTPGAANRGGCSDMAAEPVFSLLAGMYDTAQRVTLSAGPTARIYYTLDGADPSEDSIPYTGPIYMEETTVIRAVACREGCLSSNAACATYLIGENIEIPVVSIVTDPANLFDEETGIYADGPGWTPKFPHRSANFWKDWERPAHVELLEPDGTVAISQDIGLKIFGEVSRAKDQKPFSLMARDRYGKGSFDCRIFPELPYQSYKNLIIRNGQDANYSHIRNKLQVDLAMENSHVDGQAYRQCIAFVNGEYWGLYDLAEKVNEHFLAQHHGVNPNKIDLLWGNGDVILGSNEAYLELIEFVKNNDLSIQENYEYVASQVDIDNYIDWCAIEMYVAHEDTDGNTKFWRPQTPDGKWRWILYDLDYGFWHLYQPEYAERLDVFDLFLHPKGNGNAHKGDNTLIRGLLQNEGFKQKFIERFVYHCTVTFAPDKVLSRIDELSANIEPYIGRDKERWPRSIVGSTDMWKETHLQLLRDFATDRPAINLQYMQQYFGLSDAEMDRLVSQQ